METYQKRLMIVCACLIVLIKLPLLMGQGIDESPVLINEVMSSNSTTLQDAQQEFDDWIEFYNPSDTVVDLGGMYLTDDAENPVKWRVPEDQPEETLIPAKGFVLLWADGEADDRPGLHASYRLSAEGESLFLYAANGRTLIDAVSIPALESDQVFARIPNGGGDWKVITNPTPGAANEQVYEGIVAEVEFSHDRGFYDESFQLTLSCTTEDVQIYYRMDGSDPGQPSGVGRGNAASQYVSPIKISRSVCVRAMAVKPGWQASRSVTHTYLFLDQVLQQSQIQSGYPDRWNTITADYAMDSRIADNPRYRDDVLAGLRSHRTVSIACNPEHLFSTSNGIYIYSQNEGVAWERPVSMEILDPNGGQEIQVNAGLRMQGGASRSPTRPKHNMRLLFKGIYGASKLRYPLFPEWPVAEFDTVILRGGNGDSWIHPNSGQRTDAQYIRDQWCRDTQVHMQRPTAGQCYVHLYINGLYWGLYHAIERPNASYFATHQGGEPEDYDVIQHKNGTVDGNRNAWNAMMAIAEQGLASPERYQQIQDYLDLPNMVDYLILNFLVGNKDWDQNNWYGGRRRELGYGFQFMMWDSERTILGLNDNVTTKNNSNQPTSVHQRLTANTDYRMLFQDQVYRHLYNNGVLTAEACRSRWLSFADEIRLPLIAEAARWGDAHRSTPYMPEIEWQTHLDWVTNTYFPQRIDIVLNQLRDKGLAPELDPPVLTEVTSSDPTLLQVNLQSPRGQIIYTLDGNDPRLAGQESPTQDSIMLVSEANTKTVWVPTGPVDDAWRQQLSYSDRLWKTVTGLPGGVGYERNSGYESYIGGDVYDAMYGQQASCLIRIPFAIDQPLDALSEVRLKIRYDDGFIAFLNGTEIARRNADGSDSWNAQASASHPDNDALAWETIPIADFQTLLHEGTNLLAIHGLNRSTTSSDFLTVATLEATEEPAIESLVELIAPSAQIYESPITLDHSVILKARALENGVWSPLRETTLSVGPLVDSLRITEILYHPHPDLPNTEFLEISNVSDTPVNIHLVRFTEGIEFTCPQRWLDPGERVVIVQDIQAFLAVYGEQTVDSIVGQYDGKLSNGGERLTWETPTGDLIQSLDYDDSWAPKTDGQGYALISTDDPNLWQAGERFGGTPGY